MVDELKWPMLPDDLVLEKVIARGGFSEVYSGHYVKGLFGFKLLDIATRGAFAVKVLHQGEISEKATPDDIRESPIDRVNAEVEVLSSIKQSMFIVKFSDVFRKGNLIYLVLERAVTDARHLINNVDLRPNVYNYNAYPVLLIKHLCIPILLALEHIHSIGYSHNDVKEDNILITSAGVPKLSDFGLCTRIGTAVEERVGGTEFYMAPEVVLRKPVSPNSDNWSLGFTMLAMFYGASPYRQRQWSDVVRIYDSKQIPDNLAEMDDFIWSIMNIYFSYNGRIPNWPWLQIFVMKVLKYSPDHRHSLATLLIDEDVARTLSLWEDYVNGRDVSDDNFLQCIKLTKELIESFNKGRPEIIIRKPWE